MFQNMSSRGYGISNDSSYQPHHVQTQNGNFRVPSKRSSTVVPPPHQFSTAPGNFVQQGLTNTMTGGIFGGMSAGLQSHDGFTFKSAHSSTSLKTSAQRYNFFPDEPMHGHVAGGMSSMASAPYQVFGGTGMHAYGAGVAGMNGGMGGSMGVPDIYTTQGAMSMDPAVVAEKAPRKRATKVSEGGPSKTEGKAAEGKKTRKGSTKARVVDSDEDSGYSSEATPAKPKRARRGRAVAQTDSEEEWVPGGRSKADEEKSVRRTMSKGLTGTGMSAGATTGSSAGDDEDAPHVRVRHGRVRKGVAVDVNSQTESRKHKVQNPGKSSSSEKRETPPIQRKKGKCKVSKVQYPETEAPDFEFDPFAFSQSDSGEFFGRGSRTGGRSGRKTTLGPFAAALEKFFAECVNAEVNAVEDTYGAEGQHVVDAVASVCESFLHKLATEYIPQNLHKFPDYKPPASSSSSISSPSSLSSTSTSTALSSTKLARAVIPNPINDALRVKIAAHKALSATISAELDQWVSLEKRFTEAQEAEAIDEREKVESGRGREREEKGKNRGVYGAGMGVGVSGGAEGSTVEVEQTLAAASRVARVSVESVREALAGVKLEEIIPQLPTVTLSPAEVGLLQRCTALPAGVPLVTTINVTSNEPSTMMTMSTSNTSSFSFGKPMGTSFGKNHVFGFSDSSHASPNSSFLSDLSFSGHGDHSMDVSVDHSRTRTSPPVHSVPVVPSLSSNIRMLCKSILLSHNISIFKLLSIYNKLQEAVRLRQHIANVFTKYSLPQSQTHALAALDAFLQVSK